MSNPNGPQEEWRDAITVWQQGEDDACLCLRNTEESVPDVLRRLAQAGQWDAASEPDIAAVLHLAAELMELGGAIDWAGGEIMLHTESDDARAVRACFYAYKEAVLEGEGEAVADLLDSVTLDRYASYQDLALGKESSLHESDTPLIDKITVALLFSHMAPDQLAEMTPRQLIVHAVSEGMIGKQGLELLDLGRVEVHDDYASAETYSQGERALCDIAFHLEGGVWRVDLCSLFPAIESSFHSLMEANDLTEDELIEAIIGDYDEDDESE